MAKFTLHCRGNHCGSKQDTFSRPNDKKAKKYAKQIVKKYQDEVDKEQRIRKQCKGKRHDHIVRGVLFKIKAIAIFPEE